VQGDLTGYSSPDATSGNGTFECQPDGSAVLAIQICNRGTEPIADGVPITFYDGDPEDGVVICTVPTSVDLYPGDCTAVECVWLDTPDVENPRDVTVVADDDGTGSGTHTECLEGNNTAAIEEVGCLQEPE